MPQKSHLMDPWIRALSVFVTFFFFPLAALAFHEGRMDYCGGCHDLHPRDAKAGPGSGSEAWTGSRTLIGSDASSTCLRCHAEEGKFYSVLTRTGSAWTAGGDFYWLKRSFSWTREGQQIQSAGETHGHNVVAIDYGLNADGTRTTAPGGALPAADLACTSCHDPHAIAGNDIQALRMDSPRNYRMLGGRGYQAGLPASTIVFDSPAPVAAADSRDWTESDSNHPAYGSGMSEWCANCHPGFMEQGSAGKRAKHPSGADARLSREFIANYNKYVKTGDLSGVQSTAYLTLVPFESGITDPSALDPRSSAGPDPAGGARVMCLTCHRAHASAFPSIGRWDFSATFLADSHPGPQDGGVTGDDLLNRYYGRDMQAEFGPYQRQLCNKCHSQD